MPNLLKKRARQLARRHLRRLRTPKLQLLVSRWDETAWGFPTAPFSQLTDGPVTDLPNGSQISGHPCCGLVLSGSSVVPVFDWAVLVGLPTSTRSHYAISPSLSVALKLPHDTRIEEVDDIIENENLSSFCKGQVGSIKLARLEGYF